MKVGEREAVTGPVCEREGRSCVILSPLCCYGNETKLGRYCSAGFVLNEGPNACKQNGKLSLQ